MAGDIYTFMLKVKTADTPSMTIMDQAREKAESEGRTLRYVVLQLLRGWVAGYYQLGAAKR